MRDGGFRCPRCGEDRRSYGEDLCASCEERVSGAPSPVRCSKCGESKPPSEFHRDISRPSGISCHCGACKREATRGWRARPENADKLRAAVARYRERRAAPGTKLALRRALKQAVALALSIESIEAADEVVRIQLARQVRAVAQAALAKGGADR